MDGHDHKTASDGSGGRGDGKAVDPAAATVIDPVCGMRVNPATSKHHVEHAGATYRFCSAGCRTKFEAEPTKYLTPKVATAPAETHAIYT